MVKGKGEKGSKAASCMTWPVIAHRRRQGAHRAKINMHTRMKVPLKKQSSQKEKLTLGKKMS